MLQSLIGGGVDSWQIGTGIVALGTTQTTAQQLFYQTSDVGTVTAGSGVVMNALIQPGMQQAVFNSGANALKVYPPSGMQINALPTNQAISLPVNTGVILTCVSSTRIFGVLSA